MSDFEVRGLNEFGDLAKAIRLHADKKALQKEFYSGLNRETKEIRADMKKNLAAGLPSSGGVGDLLARQSGLQARARGGADMGIRIETGRKHDYVSLNAGILRHPVYGNRDVWRSQKVQPKLLEQPFMKAKPEVARAILRGMEEIARKIARSV